MLENYRKEIDEIDKKLVELFERRMDCAQKVGEYKKSKGMEIFVPEREKSIIEKRLNQVKNEEYKAYTAELFEELMRLSRSLQSKIIEPDFEIKFEKADFSKENLKLVYPGVVGSYSGEALFKSFPDAKCVYNTETFYDTAKMVKEGKADFGVLPFENNSSGAISDTLDLIMSENLSIAGEVYIDVNHCLMSAPDADISDIKEIYSHNQGFLQSKEFLSSLNVKKCPMENTAIAAKFVADSKDKTKAAIASKLAAETYGLKILKENINENAANTTRFVVISNRLTSDESCDKITAAFTTRHKSGALRDALAVFARNGVNLLHIESRPLKEKDFSYIFYVDFEGNLNSTEIKDTVSQIRGAGAEFVLLGNYKTQK